MREAEKGDLFFFFLDPLSAAGEERGASEA